MKRTVLEEAGARPDVIVNSLGWSPDLGLHRRNGYRHPAETLEEADVVLRRMPEVREKGWWRRLVERVRG